MSGDRGRLRETVEARRVLPLPSKTENKTETSTQYKAHTRALKRQHKGLSPLLMKAGRWKGKECVVREVALEEDRFRWRLEGPPPHGRATQPKVIRNRFSLPA